MCQKNPDLKNYGFYRLLDTGDYEFVSFCDSKSAQFFGFYGPQFNAYLDALLPETK